MNTNTVIIGGNLCRDISLKTTKDGKAFVHTALANNRRWTDANGQQQEETTFVDITVFGKTAENMGKYLKKGSAVLVEGRLKLDQWEDKEGKPRKNLKIVADKCSWFFEKKDSEHRSASNQKSKSDDLTGEDIPF